MNKTKYFLVGAIVLLGLFSSCASIQNTESKSGTRAPNYDRAPFL